MIWRPITKTVGLPSHSVQSAKLEKRNTRHLAKHTRKDKKFES